MLLSSSGLGCGPFKPGDTGSNPVSSTSSGTVVSGNSWLGVVRSQRHTLRDAVVVRPLSPDSVNGE